VSAAALLPLPPLLLRGRAQPCGHGDAALIPLLPPLAHLLLASRSTSPDWGRDLWVLTVTALATYALAYAILRLNHRDKQR
jgi:hypothetical protein